MKFYFLKLCLVQGIEMIKIFFFLGLDSIPFILNFVDETNP